MIRYSLLLCLFYWHAINPVNTKMTEVVSATTVGSKPFLMPVDDVFTISGIGTVVTGKVARGTVKTGDSIELVGINDRIIRSKVKSIEMFRKTVTEAKEGETCGIVLSAVEKTDVSRGIVLAKPGSMFASNTFTCELVFKTKEDGGRKFPIADNFRTQFYIYNTNFSGIIKLPAGMQNIIPAEKTIVTVKLEMPVAIEKGLPFNIMEYGKEIGSGMILEPVKN